MIEFAPAQLLNHNLVDDLIDIRDHSLHLWLLVLDKPHILPRIVDHLAVLDSLPVSHNAADHWAFFNDLHRSGMAARMASSVRSSGLSDLSGWECEGKGVDLNLKYCASSPPLLSTRSTRPPA